MEIFGGQKVQLKPKWRSDFNKQLKRDKAKEKRDFFEKQETVESRRKREMTMRCSQYHSTASCWYLWLLSQELLGSDCMPWLLLWKCTRHSRESWTWVIKSYQKCMQQELCQHRQERTIHVHHIQLSGREMHPGNKGMSSSWGSNTGLHGGRFRICMGRKMCSPTGTRFTQGIRCQAADYLWQQPNKVCTNSVEEND